MCIVFLFLFQSLPVAVIGSLYSEMFFMFAAPLGVCVCVCVSLCGDVFSSLRL